MAGGRGDVGQSNPGEMARRRRGPRGQEARVDPGAPVGGSGWLRTAGQGGAAEQAVNGGTRPWRRCAAEARRGWPGLGASGN